jgi:site-specific recombinase XerD
MARLKPHHLQNESPAVIPEADLTRLLKTCEAETHEDRRDAAMIRLLTHSGMQRAGLVGLKADDVDFETNIALGLGKGAARGPARSAARPPSCSIATYPSVRSIRTPRC